jgi:hypothetical protein
MSMNGIPARARSGDSVFKIPSAKNAANETARATEIGNNAIHTS